MKPELPESIDVGLKAVSDGVGLEVALIVNSAAPEFPPPGAGLITLTEAVPALAMSAVLT